MINAIVSHMERSQSQPATRAEFVSASRITAARLIEILGQMDGKPHQVRRRLTGILNIHQRLLEREPSNNQRTP